MRRGHHCCGMIKGFVLRLDAEAAAAEIADDRLRHEFGFPVSLNTKIAAAKSCGSRHWVADGDERMY